MDEITLAAKVDAIEAWLRTPWCHGSHPTYAQTFDLGWIDHDWAQWSERDVEIARSELGRRLDIDGFVLKIIEPPEAHYITFPGRPS